MYCNKKSGFSLIELLVVIAIIAILAAIIFPVMSAAKKHARQTQCMTNMYQIYTAMKMFEQDQHAYPDFIVGPVEYKYPVSGQIVYDPETPSTDSGDPATPNLVPMDSSDGMIDDRPVALFPQYIKSSTGLICSDAIMHGVANGLDGNPETAEQDYTKTDIVDDPLFCDDDKVSPYWQYMSGTYINAAMDTGRRANGITIGDETAIPKVRHPYKLYAYSVYDSQIPSGKMEREAHYALNWLKVDGNDFSRADGNTDASEQTASNYVRQLKWKYPPEDTVITWCSFHRDIDGDGNPQTGTKDIVLFLDGRVKLVDSKAMADWKEAWQVVSPK